MKEKQEVLFIGIDVSKDTYAVELTPIWVPDETHEAIRDLVRARDSAARDQRQKRQMISFMLKINK